MSIQKNLGFYGKVELLKIPKKVSGRKRICWKITCWRWESGAGRNGAAVLSGDIPLREPDFPLPENAPQRRKASSESPASQSGGTGPSSGYAHPHPFSPLPPQREGLFPQTAAAEGQSPEFIPLLWISWINWWIFWEIRSCRPGSTGRFWRPALRRPG